MTKHFAFNVHSPEERDEAFMGYWDGRRNSGMIDPMFDRDQIEEMLQSDKLSWWSSITWFKDDNWVEVECSPENYPNGRSNGVDKDLVNSIIDHCLSSPDFDHKNLPQGATFESLTECQEYAENSISVRMPDQTQLIIGVRRPTTIETDHGSKQAYVFVSGFDWEPAYLQPSEEAVALYGGDCILDKGSLSPSCSLESGQIFETKSGSYVKLDQQHPENSDTWRVAEWDDGSWNDNEEYVSALDLTEIVSEVPSAAPTFR